MEGFDIDLRSYKVRVSFVEPMGWTWEGRGPGDEDLRADTNNENGGFFDSREAAQEDAVWTIEDHAQQEEWIDGETLRLQVMKSKRDDR